MQVNEGIAIYNIAMLIEDIATQLDFFSEAL
jgi:hypothetical protein